ncbi:uncharacterized protein LOC110437216 [Sorghum bicolor]|uniref:uncharacterized protein LOC110437216 n=1 Tax=Sorghum bicolor TaxID=4558 RepID=UPI000B425366|nr:uncharacterized protein LOC110437216 [Sorghum bicolor]|eukprot:XP_021321254.1 uncharacterized protein LOC110437216 [Sorghum bicolor]
MTRYENSSHIAWRQEPVDDIAFMTLRAASAVGGERRARGQRDLDDRRWAGSRWSCLSLSLGQGVVVWVEATRAALPAGRLKERESPVTATTKSGIMSQASSSTVRSRRQSAARDVVEPRPLAIVAAGSLPIGVDLEAPIDEVTRLPLIVCPTCKDVRVFAANTKNGSNVGKRFFKCPRKNYNNGTCDRFWFEKEYVVYLHDNGHLPSASSTIAAGSTTEVPELVKKIDSLEQNLNKVQEMVSKNREGMGCFICLVCGCVNVTIVLLVAIFLVVAFVLK